MSGQAVIPPQRVPLAAAVVVAGQQYTAVKERAAIRLTMRVAIERCIVRLDSDVKKLSAKRTHQPGRDACSLEGVVQVSDPGDRDCADVTGFDRGEGAGVAGEDDVTGIEGQVAGEVDECFGDVPGQLAGVGGGDQFPVDVDGYRDAGGVEVGFDPWPDGCEPVTVLGLGHHLVEWNLVDGGDVVADGVAEDRRGDVGGGQVAAGAPDDDGEFGLDMYLTEMVVQDDGGVGVGDGPRRLQERLRRS